MFLKLEDDLKKYIATTLLLLMPVLLCYIFLTKIELNAQTEIRDLRYDYPYSLSLNKNGGTGGSDTVIITLDANGFYRFDKTSIQIPSRPGFIFSGYAVLGNNFDNETYIQNLIYDAKGNLISYNSFSRDFIPAFQPIEKQTLYALWAKPLKITFEKNGGTGGTDEAIMIVDGNNHLYRPWLDLPAISAPNIKGQQFLGYCYNQKRTKESMIYWANSTGSQYHFDGTLLNQNLIYPDSPYGSKFKLTIAADGILEYRCYNFEDNDWEVINNDITFYALWQNKGTVTINLDMSEADNWSGENQFTVSTLAPEQNVPHLPWPKKSGYLFAGFYDEPNGQGNVWANSYIYESQKSLYWTGIWTAKGDSEITLYPYFVKSDSKFNFSIYLDGQGADDFFIYINGTENPLSVIQLPEKTGFSFMGYYDQPNGLGNRYINADGSSNKTWDKEDIFFNATTSPQQNIVNSTLYAYWLPVSGSEYFKLLQSIECLEEKDYTPQSWKNFNESLKAINLKLIKDSAISELSDASFKIHSSFNLLEIVDSDYTYYNELLFYSQSLMQNTSTNYFKYTSESLDNFRWRFNDYQPLLPNQKQSKVDSEIIILKSYLAMLKKQPARFQEVYEQYKKRTNILQEIIEEIRINDLYENGAWQQVFNHPKYTSQSVALFHAYIHYIDPIYFWLDASNASILLLETQINKIDKAVQILITEQSNADYDEYNRLVKKVIAIQKNDYSKASYSEYSKMIDNVNLNLTQFNSPYEVNSEIVKIQTALNVLQPNTWQIWLTVTPIVILVTTALIFWIRKNKKSQKISQ
ncbi:MAG: hypothetical protein FWE36_06550 [Erysipelotrichales bacterium]|nr:hypothetical protein [Erysipelotrichales bacterium]